MLIVDPFLNTINGISVSAMKKKLEKEQAEVTGEHGA